MKPKDYPEVSKYEQLNASVRDLLIDLVIEISQVIFNKQGCFIFYFNIRAFKSSINQIQFNIKKGR